MINNLELGPRCNKLTTSNTKEQQYPCNWILVNLRSFLSHNIYERERERGVCVREIKPNIVILPHISFITKNIPICHMMIVFIQIYVTYIHTHTHTHTCSMLVNMHPQSIGIFGLKDMTNAFDLLSDILNMYIILGDQSTMKCTHKCTEISP